MKLNLGCGFDKRVGYINIDIRGEVHPNVVGDIGKIPYPYDKESIDEIIAKDILEHFPFSSVDLLIKEWNRILKRGGRIYIQVPDLEYMAREVILSKKYGFKKISFWLYGEQNYPANFHKSGFTILTLTILLEQAFFKVESIKNNGGTNIMCWAIKK